MNDDMPHLETVEDHLSFFDLFDLPDFYRLKIDLAIAASFWSEHDLEGPQ